MPNNGMMFVSLFFLGSFVPFFVIFIVYGLKGLFRFHMVFVTFSRFAWTHSCGQMEEAA